MASKKIEKSSIKKFWAMVAQKGDLLLQKVKSFVSILALPLRYIKATYQRWPRVWQVCSLYLIVLIFAGAIFLWRSTQLRTINPYIEKINFTELEDENVPDKDDKIVEHGESSEPAAAGGTAGAIPGDEVTAPASAQAVWPVKGRELIRKYGQPYEERSWKCRIWKTSESIEIKADSEEEVCAILGGTVKNIIEKGFPGKAVKIEHAGDIIVYYAALDKICVEEGQQVAAGDVIGTVVRGEKERPAYLYLEMKLEGRHIDPLEILSP